MRGLQNNSLALLQRALVVQTAQPRVPALRGEADSSDSTQSANNAIRSSEAVPGGARCMGGARSFGAGDTAAGERVCVGCGACRAQIKTAWIGGVYPGLMPATDAGRGRSRTGRPQGSKSKHSIRTRIEAFFTDNPTQGLTSALAAEQFDTTYPTVNMELSKLYKAGFLTKRKQSYTVIYSKAGTQ